MTEKLPHPYLKLDMAGGVDEYALVISLDDLPYYAAQGWLTYQQVNLPEGDEYAALQYGDVNFETETLVFGKPSTLSETGVDVLVGRTVQDWSGHLGTYGMGGAGFFGLLLDGGEYFVYAVWGAGRYILLNGRVLETLPNLYHQVRPWISSYSGEQKWDELTPKLVGSKITSATLDRDCFSLHLIDAEGNPATLEFVKNDRRLPRVRGRHKNAYKSGEIAEYLLWTVQDSVLVV